MSDKFRNYSSAITRTPPFSMANGITTQTEKVDVYLAREQHQKYIETLKELGIQVTILPPIDVLPDSHFIEDAAIIHRKKMILTKPGATERRAEVNAIRENINSNLDIIELNLENSCGTIDGGDVLFVGNDVLIGISYRTNLVGAHQLARALTSIDPLLRFHYVEFTGVLHLKSGFSALNANTLLGNPLIKLKNPLHIANIVWLPKNEGYAANTLVANGAALYFSECHTTAKLLEKVHLNPIALNLSEFKKMDGSFTCLSLLW